MTDDGDALEGKIRELRDILAHAIESQSLEGLLKHLHGASPGTPAERALLLALVESAAIHTTTLLRFTAELLAEHERPDPGAPGE